MSPSNIPMELRLSPIQLYRRLLRECSYLPPAFRSKIEGRIRKRFHANIKDSRAEKHVRTATTALRTLRAANTGEQEAMMQLMQHGFGRDGFRRREIMWSFVRPQGADNAQALEAAMNTTIENDKGSIVPSGETKKKKKPIKDSFYLRWDQAKIKQILASQKQQEKETQHSTSWRTTGIKNLNPDQYVPEKTIWGKPPVPRLVMSKRARWWRANAEKIMPPLGKGEWDLLGKLARGAQNTEEWKVPSRRQPATPVIEDTDEADHARALLDYARAKTSSVESRSKLRQVRWYGRKDTGPFSRGQEDRTLSARWFRRAYNRIWQTTPAMHQDPNTLQHSFTWGGLPPKMPDATARQKAVFDGVDKKGNIQTPK
ncbi:hypothetical protein K4F52_002600 [Lecanicillium sp. MT-2017a]|nr:hypothetical protein K4F52_002600 [Lecanicillium sp. MT-2017a]